MNDLNSHSEKTRHAEAGREHGDPCPGCRRQLPVRGKQPGEVAAHWECAACHTPLTGVLIRGIAAHEADAIRLARAHFDATAVPAITPAVRQLVQDFIAARRQDHSPEKRSEGPRASVQLDVIAVPLDERLSPRSKPVRGIVVDLSPHGLGMITPAPIVDQQIAVQMGNAGGVVQVVGDVAWTRDIGSGCYSFGVRFRLRFGRNTVTSEVSSTTSKR